MGTPRRALLWLPAAAAAAITAAVALGRPASARLTDLAVYTGAVDGLRHGESLYDFVSAGNAPFTYPPFAALLFLPLAGVPAVPLQVLWTLATLATVALLAALLDRRRAPAYAFVLILSAPVSSDLRYGQVSLFLAAAVTADVLALRHSRWQGTLIGVAAAIKLTPLIVIPMLWLTGRRRAALTAAGTFAACGLTALIALPGDSWRFWTGEILRAGGLGTLTGAGNQSLNGMLLRFDLPEPARLTLVLILGGGIAAVALWHAGRLGRRGSWLPALVVTGAASVVLSPVSWTHHQTWLVMAALLPVRGRAWPWAVLAMMLLPVTALGPPLWENARLLLAITVATLTPLLLDSTGRSRTGGPGAGEANRPRWRMTPRVRCRRGLTARRREDHLGVAPAGRRGGRPSREHADAGGPAEPRPPPPSAAAPVRRGLRAPRATARRPSSTPPAVLDREHRDTRGRAGQPCGRGRTRTGPATDPPGRATRARLARTSVS